MYSVGVDGDDDLGIPVYRDPGLTAYRHKLLDRYELETRKVDGELVLVRDESGAPIMINPSEPDGDWVFVDTRE